MLHPGRRPDRRITAESGVILAREYAEVVAHNLIRYLALRYLARPFAEIRPALWKWTGPVANASRGIPGPSRGIGHRYSESGQATQDTHIRW